MADDERVSYLDSDEAREMYASYRAASPAERRRVIDGREYSGDPSPCEMGEHLDTEDGRCLLCGEWVIGP